MTSKKVVKIRKTFPKVREELKRYGVILTHKQIADYAAKDSVTRRDVLKYDSTDTMVREYMIMFVVHDVLGKGYDWPCNGNDAEWTNLFYDKFFNAAIAKDIKVVPEILKLAKDGTFRERAREYREETRFK